MENKYSQCNEELFIFEYFKDKNNGVVVDIGAADGVTNSNSRHLIEIGWSGLLVEPNKKNFNKLKNLYIESTNIKLENVGCSDLSQENVTFHIDKNDEYEQLSTFSSEQTLKCISIYNCEFVTDNVDLIKTSELLSKHNILHIDYLSIDTESFDYKVILGIDFDVCNVDLISVEHTHPEMEEKLSRYGYSVIHSNPCNIFYAKK